GGLEERLAFALSVNIDESAAQLTKSADRDGLIVDVGVTATGTRQTTTQQDFVIFEGRIEEALDLGSLFLAGEFKAAGDPQFLGAGADQVGGAAFAEQQ